MRDAIRNFAKQFSYAPELQNAGKIKKYPWNILVGMGGSHLAADLALAWKPGLNLSVYSDYGLPPLPKGHIEQCLTIACSYSGNTEETIEAFTAARKKKLPLVAIAAGGRLIKLAEKYGTPFVQIPNTGIQPRSSLGFMIRALFCTINESSGLRESRRLANALRPMSFEATGRALAEKIRGRVPVVYASGKNRAIAANWKIKFNETGKIPSFYNVFPELNHNEMTGFDAKESSKHLSAPFHFILLKDAEDHPRIQKRMDILEKLYTDRGLPVETIDMQGKGRLERIFSSLLLADWTALSLAEMYGLESEQVPMVEEFKKLMT